MCFVLAQPLHVSLPEASPGLLWDCRALPKETPQLSPALAAPCSPLYVGTGGPPVLAVLHRFWGAATSPSGVLPSTPAPLQHAGTARAGQEWALVSLSRRKSLSWTELCTIDKASQMKNCFPFLAESKISSDGDDALNNDNLHSSLTARRELRVHVLSSFTALKAYKSLSSLFKHSPTLGFI